MDRLHLLFVGLLVGTELFFSALSLLNLRYGARTVAAEREWVDEMLDVEDTNELLAYQQAGTKLGLLQSWTTLALVLLALYGGVLTEAVAALRSFGLGELAQGVVFLLGAVVALFAVSLPFDYVSTFRVEERFGFNNQTRGLWARDKALGLGISLVIAAVLGGAVLAAISFLPEWWWLAGLALFVAFSLAMQVLYPRVIAPLFWEFDPVESGELREAVEDVFDRAGFTCSQIYEMDASRRSGHSNAYFIGFGETKRVVLFDTLVDQMDLPEVQSVLAHELAHWKRAHVWKQMGAEYLRLGVVFFALGYLLDTGWLYDMFGLPAGVEYAGLALALLWVYPLLRLSAPLSNYLSFRHEREADAFATRVMGDGTPLADALCRLTSENLGNPFPHPLYAAFHHQHPSVPERIRHIREESG